MPDKLDDCMSKIDSLSKRFDNYVRVRQDDLYSKLKGVGKRRPLHPRFDRSDADEEERQKSLFSELPEQRKKESKFWTKPKMRAASSKESQRIRQEISRREFDSRPRMDKSQVAELYNLMHLARTSLSGTTYTKYHQKLWAAKEFIKANPKFSSKDVWAAFELSYQPPDNGRNRQQERARKARLTEFGDNTSIKEF